MSKDILEYPASYLEKASNAGLHDWDNGRVGDKPLNATSYDEGITAEPWDNDIFSIDVVDAKKVRQLWTHRNLSYVSSSSSVQTQTDDETEHTGESKEEPPHDWRSSPADLLAKLQESSISRDELFEAILFSEIAKFDIAQTKQLVPLLFLFINDHRLSQDEDVKIVMGAAIRKLAMNLPQPQIEKYADFFQLTDTDTLPCEIELELAKAIQWRLMSDPTRLLTTNYPHLESSLTEIAIDYLSPRLILQENYASVVLQAGLTLMLLNDQAACKILQSIQDLEIGWFEELFARRLGKLIKQLTTIEEPTLQDVISNLRHYLSELENESNQIACQPGD